MPDDFRSVNYSSIDRIRVLRDDPTYAEVMLGGKTYLSPATLAIKWLEGHCKQYGIKHSVSTLSYEN